MPTVRGWLPTLVAAVLLSATVAGQNRPPARPSSPSSLSPLSGIINLPRSPRNANYRIEARLDPATRILTGSEVIEWRNITQRSTNEVQFHTYWNAFRDEKSTFLRERALLRTTDYEDDRFARLTITHLRIGDRELISTATFIAPDDGNADDATVMRVALADAVAPGESLRITVDWTARVPKPFARTGVIGNFYFFAQWFPKLGVLEESGWNCHQFHAITEFFSDFGVYDVHLTVPAGWQVGATGVARSTTDNHDGTATHAYYQEDVHDFAWTTSPDLVERTAEFVPDAASTSRGQHPVRLRVLMQPEHAAQAERHVGAARTALRYYSQWAGPYPYDQLTIVDPAFRSEADGMEYPTLITGGTPWLIPAAVTASTPEEVVIHEAGHQFFYGVVATNEFEDAWMDEGINTYLTARAMVQDFPQTYYERRLLGGALPWVERHLPLSREHYWNRYNGYRRTPKSDAQSTPAFRYSLAGGQTVIYNKTALWLNTLERYLGWPTMERVLQTYFTRWQFAHPRPADFFAVVNEVSGQDLTWFFDQVYRSSNAFDYAIDTLGSVRDGDGYRTDVIVGRRGEATFPVDVAVSFADGERVLRHWDGRDRWTQYTLRSKARAVSAEVDPEHVLLLDINVTNNSRAVAPEGGNAATRWSLKWLVWLQDALLSWAFFA